MRRLGTVHITKVMGIGFELKNVFKARPHPGLLLQEKEQHMNIFLFTKRFPDRFRFSYLEWWTWEKPSPGGEGWVRAS
jgi:hypothetical protein